MGDGKLIGEGHGLTVNIAATGRKKWSLRLQLVNKIELRLFNRALLFYEIV